MTPFISTDRKIRNIGHCDTHSPKYLKYVIVISRRVVLQRTAKKCTKDQNSRAEPLWLCSLNLLFGDVLIAVAVVVC